MIRLVLLMGALLCSASSWAMPMLNVVAGEIVGAKGLVVDGTNYNVELLDRSCSSVFSGCDEASDFDFQDAVTALEAANELLAAFQNFTSSPGVVTPNCITSRACQIYVPFSLAGLDVVAQTTQLRGNDPTDVFVRSSPIQRSGSIRNGELFARFTVSEPPIALLLGLPLAAMLWRKRQPKEFREH